MASLTHLLSSFKDTHNKNLRKFIYEYKENIEWNNINVVKAWTYTKSLDEAFHQFESLFSDIKFFESSQPIKQFDQSVDNTALKNEVFEEDVDIEFMTDSQISTQNDLVWKFLQALFPYFMNDESQQLIDYLIYKNNITITFAEKLIALFIQYHECSYYSKLLSLIQLGSSSAFNSLYGSLRSASNDFKEHRNINRNLILDEICGSFELFKQVSEIYSNLISNSKLNNNIASFNTIINTEYVLTNGKSMDDNEIRFMSTIIARGLERVDDAECIGSQMCTLIAMFSYTDLTVKLQNELVNCLKPILNKMNETEKLSLDMIIVFKNIITILYFIVKSQKQKLNKLEDDVTKLFFSIFMKHDSINVVFNNLQTIKSFESQRIIVLLVNSLLSLYSKKSEMRQKLNDEGNKTGFEMAEMEYLLKYINDHFEQDCLKMVIFYTIDTLNINNHQNKTRGNSIIKLHSVKNKITVNDNLNEIGQVSLCVEILMILKKINRNLLDTTVMDYVNELDKEETCEQIEVILLVLATISDDIVYRLLYVYNKFNKIDLSKMGFNKEELNDMKFSLSMFYEKNLMNLDKSMRYNEIVDFIVSSYFTNKNGSSERNMLVYRFLCVSLEHETRQKAVLNNQTLWINLPVEVSFPTLIRALQKTVDEIDNSFEYNERITNDPGLDLDQIENETTEDILRPYINHFKTMDDKIEKINKIINIINKIASESNDKSVERFNSLLDPLIAFLDSFIFTYDNKFNYNESNLIKKPIFENNLNNNGTKHTNNHDSSFNNNNLNHNNNFNNNSNNIFNNFDNNCNYNQSPIIGNGHLNGTDNKMEVESRSDKNHVHFEPYKMTHSELIRNNHRLIVMMKEELLLGGSYYVTESGKGKGFYNDQNKFDCKRGVVSVPLFLYNYAESMNYIVSGGKDKELVFIQCVEMLGLQLKLLRLKVESVSMSTFLNNCLFKFFIKYDFMLFDHLNEINSVVESNRIYLILSNDNYYSLFLQFLNLLIKSAYYSEFNKTALESNQNNSSQDTFQNNRLKILIHYVMRSLELLRIDRFRFENNGFRLMLKEEGNVVKWKMVVPPKYKYHFINQQYQRFFMNTEVGTMLSNNYFEHEEVSVECYDYLGYVFDGKVENLAGNVFNVMNKIFVGLNRINESMAVYMGIVVNSLDLLYDRSFLVTKEVDAMFAIMTRQLCEYFQKKHNEFTIEEFSKHYNAFISIFDDDGFWNMKCLERSCLIYDIKNVFDHSPVNNCNNHKGNNENGNNNRFNSNGTTNGNHMHIDLSRDGSNNSINNHPVGFKKKYFNNAKVEFINIIVKFIMNYNNNNSNYNHNEPEEYNSRNSGVYRNEYFSINENAVTEKFVDRLKENKMVYGTLVKMSAVSNRWLCNNANTKDIIECGATNDYFKEWIYKQYEEVFKEDFRIFENLQNNLPCDLNKIGDNEFESKMDVDLPESSGSGYVEVMLASTLDILERFINFCNYFTIIAAVGDPKNEYLETTCLISSKMVKACGYVKQYLRKLMESNLNNANPDAVNGEVECLVNYCYKMCDDYAVIACYNLREGKMYKVDNQLMAEIIGGLSAYYGEVRLQYMKQLFKWVFDSREAGTEIVSKLLVYTQNMNLQNELINYLINNTSSLKLYEELACFIKKTNWKDSQKIGTIKKIVLNVVMATHMDNEYVHEFIFNNLKFMFLTYNQNIIAILEPGLLDHLYCENENEPVSNSVENVSEEELEEFKLLHDEILLTTNSMMRKIIGVKIKEMYKFDRKFNEFFHILCDFVLICVKCLGKDYIKTLGKLIVNTISIQLKIDEADSKEHLNTTIKTTISSFINNLVRFEERVDYSVIEELLKLPLDNDWDQEIAQRWSGYILYMFFINTDDQYLKNIKLDEDELVAKPKEIGEQKELDKTDIYTILQRFIDDYKEPLQILTEMLWINLYTEFEEKDINYLHIKEMEGYVSPELSVKKRVKSSDEKKYKLYVFILIYMKNKKFYKLSGKLLESWDKKTEDYARLTKLNEFIYAMVCSFVFYKYYKSPHLTNKKVIKQNGEKEVKNEEYITKAISEVLMTIFRNNKRGGINLHVFGLLLLINRRKVTKDLRRQDPSRIKIRSENLFDKRLFFLRAVKVMLTHNNKVSDNLKTKSEECDMRFEREIYNMEQRTSKMIFEIFREGKGLLKNDHEDDVEESVVSYRNQAWLYLINNGREVNKGFVEVLDDCLTTVLANDEAQYNRGWVYLDLVYSMKYIITKAILLEEAKKRNKEEVSPVVKTKKENRNYKTNEQNEHEYCELQADKVFMEVLNVILTKEKEFKKILLEGRGAKEIVKASVLLILVVLCRWLNDYIKAEFYDFIIEVVTNYCENDTKNEEEEYYVVGHEEAMKVGQEIMNNKIAKIISDLSREKREELKYCDNKKLVSILAWYLPRRMKSISILKVFLSESEKMGIIDARENFRKISVLCKVMSMVFMSKESVHNYRVEFENYIALPLKHYDSMGSELIKNSRYRRLNKSGAKPNSYKDIEEILTTCTKFRSSLFKKEVKEDKLLEIFESEFLALVVSLCAKVSLNKIIEIVEKNIEMGTREKEKVKTKNSVNTNLNLKMLLMQLVSLVTANVHTGMTNQIAEKVNEKIETITSLVCTDAKELDDLDSKDNDNYSIETTYMNGILLIQLIQRIAETWSIQKGGVNVTMVNKWVASLQGLIASWEYVSQIEDEVFKEYQNKWEESLEKAIKAMIDLFEHDDDKIMKVDKCLSESVITHSVVVKRFCLNLMKNIWSTHGDKMKITLRQTMTVVKELTDDEDEIVRLLAYEVKNILRLIKEQE